MHTSLSARKGPEFFILSTHQFFPIHKLIFYFSSNHHYLFSVLVVSVRKITVYFLIYSFLWPFLNPSQYSCALTVELSQSSPDAEQYVLTKSSCSHINISSHHHWLIIMSPRPDDDGDWMLCCLLFVSYAMNYELDLWLLKEIVMKWTKQLISDWFLGLGPYIDPWAVQQSKHSSNEDSTKTVVECRPYALCSC